MPTTAPMPPAKLFIERVARVPWWGGLALAALSYLLLAELAQVVQPVSRTAEGLADALGLLLRMVLALLFGLGQYLVPIGCAAGAVLSVWHQRQVNRRRRDAARVEAAKGMDTLL